jgi:hypothetical protein
MNYVATVIDQVEAKNPREPEFIQAIERFTLY